MLLLRVLLGHGRSTVRSWQEYCQVMGGGVMSRREKSNVRSWGGNVTSGRVLSVHGGQCHVGKRVMSGHVGSNVTLGKEYCQVMGGVMSLREKSTVRSWG